MTERDFAARLAGFQITLGHMEQYMSDARAAHKETMAALHGLETRVTRLEERMVSRSDVQANTLHSATDQAVAQERVRAGKALRGQIATVAAIAGTVGSISGLVIAIISAALGGQ